MTVTEPVASDKLSRAERLRICRTELGFSPETKEELTVITRLLDIGRVAIPTAAELMREVQLHHRRSNTQFNDLSAPESIAHAFIARMHSSELAAHELRYLLHRLSGVLSPSTRLGEIESLHSDARSAGVIALGRFDMRSKHSDDVLSDDQILDPRGHALEMTVKIAARSGAERTGQIGAAERNHSNRATYWLEQARGATKHGGIKKFYKETLSPADQALVLQ